jgi:oxygen-dependent protoporphyrinogen oxidase
MSRIVVVGAGLSGLAAGWRLRQAGHEVVVAEQSEAVGGSARSVRHG